MHELSIALSIVETLEEESASRGGVRVTAVYLRLGALSGVAKEALLSSYDLACEDSMLRGSRLVIEEVPVVVYCRSCALSRRLPSLQQFCCPICGAPTSEVVEGKELEVAALEIEE
jgi:hydrogenase nickel incorporation protein HypA/HybF